jgi:hypothetical protein
VECGSVEVVELSEEKRGKEEAKTCFLYPLSGPLLLYSVALAFIAPPSTSARATRANEVKRRRMTVRVKNEKRRLRRS